MKYPSAAGSGVGEPVESGSGATERGRVMGGQKGEGENSLSAVLSKKSKAQGSISEGGRSGVGHKTRLDAELAKEGKDSDQSLLRPEANGSPNPIGFDVFDSHDSASASLVDILDNAFREGVPSDLPKVQPPRASPNSRHNASATAYVNDSSIQELNDLIAQFGGVESVAAEPYIGGTKDKFGEVGSS